MVGVTEARISLELELLEESSNLKSGGARSRNVARSLAGCRVDEKTISCVAYE